MEQRSMALKSVCTLHLRGGDKWCAPLPRLPISFALCCYPQAKSHNHQITDDIGWGKWLFASRADPVADQKCFLPFQDAGTGEHWPSKPGETPLEEPHGIPCASAFFWDNSFDGASSLAVAFENAWPTWRDFRANNKLCPGESQL